MLQSRTLAKRVPRLVAQALKTAFSGVRFSSSGPESQASSVNATQTGRSGSISTQVAGEKGNAAPQKDQKRERREPFNRKLRDISVQVKQSVESANGAEVGEAIDILEEGISYLREIQETEKITDDLLYSVFQPVTAVLFDKILADSATLGSRSVEDVLDMLITQKIAHNYHFLKVAEHTVKANPNTTGYTQVLQLWLRYLEFVKDNSIGRMPYVIRLPFLPYRERNFDNRDFQNLAYFSYVMHCLDSGVEYNVKDAMKILQIQDVSRVPQKFHVTGTLKRLKVPELKEAVSKYERQINDLNIKAMDPNGPFVVKRIEAARLQNNPALLNTLFEQMKTASVTNEVPITEATFNRVMNTYIELHKFDEALDIFRNLLEVKGTPSAATWGLAIKAMGHPTNVKELSSAAKKSMVDNVENTVKTMIASGVEMNARTLAVVVGAFAALNRVDLVDQYLETYKDLPVVHLTRNNILLGLVSNKRIDEAEAKLKEYLKADETYKPSTGLMNAYLAHYVSSGNDKAVEGLIKYMKENGIAEDVGTITTFISYYFKMYRNKGQVPDVSALLKLLKENVPYNQFTTTAIIDGLAKDGVNLEAARSVFDHFCKENPRFKYNMGVLTTLITAELDFGSIANALELFDFYVAKLRNDTRAWNMMITALLPKQEKLALDYYNRLLEQVPFNVKPNYFTYYFMLDHFIKTGNDKRIQWTLDEIANNNVGELGNSLPRMIDRLKHKFDVKPQLLAKVSKPRQSPL